MNKPGRRAGPKSRPYATMWVNSYYCNMHCYLDSSVVLRKILGQTPQLHGWPKIRLGFSSYLLRIECLRTLDRLHQSGALDHENLAECRKRFFEIIERVALLPLSHKVLTRAEQSFPTPLRTLDGLHLATAIIWRETNRKDFMFATHDDELALAAKAEGLEILT